VLKVIYVLRRGSFGTRGIFNDSHAAVCSWAKTENVSLLEERLSFPIDRAITRQYPPFHSAMIESQIISLLFNLFVCLITFFFTRNYELIN